MNRKLLYIIIAIIIIAGAIMGITKGFNKGVTYANSQKIEVYINQKIDKNDIQEIADDIFGKNTPKQIQTVEIFNDMIAITVQSATDEQLDNLVKTVNEKYGLEYTRDDVNIIYIPAIHIKDMIKEYVLSAVFIIGIAFIYMIIRYYKIKTGKVICVTLLSVIIPEAVLASIYTIFRLPLNEITMPLVLLVLILSIFIEGLYLDKVVEKLKKKEEEFVEEEK